MCAADHCGQEFCHPHGFLAGKPIDFNLEILRPKFANEDGTAQKVTRQHPIAESRRQVASALDDTLCIVLRTSSHLALAGHPPEWLL